MKKGKILSQDDQILNLIANPATSVKNAIKAAKVLSDSSEAWKVLLARQDVVNYINHFSPAMEIWCAKFANNDSLWDFILCDLNVYNYLSGLIKSNREEAIAFSIKIDSIRFYKYIFYKFNLSLDECIDWAKKVNNNEVSKFVLDKFGGSVREHVEIAEMISCVGLLKEDVHTMTYI